MAEEAEKKLLYSRLDGVLRDVNFRAAPSTITYMHTLKMQNLLYYNTSTNVIHISRLSANDIVDEM